LNEFLRIASDRELLKNAGSISAQMAKEHAETEFEKYRIIQDRIFRSDFDSLFEEAARVNVKKKNKK